MEERQGFLFDCEADLTVRRFLRASILRVNVVEFRK